jgi:hypothetical protein
MGTLQTACATVRGMPPHVFSFLPAPNAPASSHGLSQETVAEYCVRSGYRYSIHYHALAIHSPCTRHALTMHSPYTHYALTVHCARTNCSHDRPIRLCLNPTYTGVVLHNMQQQQRDAALQVISALPSYDMYHRNQRLLLDPLSVSYQFLSQQFQASLVPHRGLSVARRGTGDHVRPAPLLRIKRIEHVQNVRLINNYTASRNNIAGLNR